MGNGASAVLQWGSGGPLGAFALQELQAGQREAEHNVSRERSGRLGRRWDSWKRNS